MENHDEYVYEGEPFRFRKTPHVDETIKEHFERHVLPRIDTCDTTKYHACTRLGKETKRHFETAVLPCLT
jgi:hypothetical protein